eukprot:4330984-Prymnesium_polylepis.1
MSNAKTRLTIREDGFMVLDSPYCVYELEGRKPRAMGIGAPLSSYWRFGGGTNDNHEPGCPAQRALRASVAHVPPRAQPRHSRRATTAVVRAGT